MLDNELIELVKKIRGLKAEAQTVEVKSAQGGCPRKLYDTLSGFSNQDSGGIIVFGLDENSGFALNDIYDLQDLQKSVTEQCQQMEPPVRAVFTFAELDGKKIASAEIPALELSRRPCYYKGKGLYKGAYLRVGDADMPMTDYEIYSYEAFRKHVHDDERPVERASLEYMDKVKLAGYIAENRNDRPGFAMMSDEQACEMLNITRDGIPTLAAVMNFAILPQSYFPQFSVTAVVVPGTEIGETGSMGERFLDNKRIRGTIAEMVEGTVSFCRRNMKTKTIIDKNSGRREDETEYPVAAIREAVLNALIHRDYSSYTEGTPVQIEMYSNRMEIHSPGSLYGRMTVEQLGKAKPDLRNPALATMTESQTEAENRYSGIPTMRREMNLRGLPEPVFENRRNEFVVTFYNSSTSEALPESGPGSSLDRACNDRISILEFCRSPRSRSEIAEFMGLRSVGYAAAKYISPMVKKGELGMTLPEKPKSRNQKYYTLRQDRPEHM